MLLLGYDPAKHAVLSYHAGQDMQIVWKILAGIDQMLFPRLHIDKCMTTIPGTSLQPVSIRGLVCNMMDIPPGKHQSRLKDVYRKLYGFEFVRLHSAEPDTLILMDVALILSAYG